MLDFKTFKTPSAVNFKRDCFSAGDRLTDDDTRLYQSLNGSLIHAMIFTRPDLAYVIGTLSKYVSKPCKQHLIAAKRVFRYLQLTKNFHLKYSRGTPGDTLELYGYSDAS